jgi:hypothetical protein
MFQCYFWVTAKHGCGEARGLSRPDQLLIAQSGYKSAERDFSRYLNNWEPVAEHNS